MTSNSKVIWHFNTWTSSTISHLNKYVKLILLYYGEWCLKGEIAFTTYLNIQIEPSLISLSKSSPIYTLNTPREHAIKHICYPNMLHTVLIENPTWIYFFFPVSYLCIIEISTAIYRLDNDVSLFIFIRIILHYLWCCS